MPHSKPAATSRTSSLTRRRDPISAVVDDRAVADEADLGAAHDLAVGDHAAGDRAELGGLEDRPDLDLADGLLDLLRREHALHGVAEVVERAVDDRVCADLDALAVGERAASPTGRTLKPRTIASDAAARLTSDSVMPPTPERTTVTCTSSCGQLGDLVLERLERAGHVGLEDERELLESAARTGRRSSPANLAAAAAGLLLELEALRALAGERAGLAVVLDDVGVLAGLGHGVEAEHLDRLGRRRPP